MDTHPKATAYAEKAVIVNGVKTVMVDDTDPGANFLPMQVALTLLLRMGKEHPEIATPPADSPEFKRQAAQLMDAGVEFVPPYLSQLTEAGIDWEEA